MGVYIPILTNYQVGKKQDTKTPLEGASLYLAPFSWGEWGFSFASIVWRGPSTLNRVTNGDSSRWPLGISYEAAVFW